MAILTCRGLYSKTESPKFEAVLIMAPLACATLMAVFLFFAKRMVSVMKCSGLNFSIIFSRLFVMVWNLSYPSLYKSSAVKSPHYLFFEERRLPRDRNRGQPQEP